MNTFLTLLFFFVLLLPFFTDPASSFSHQHRYINSLPLTGRRPQQYFEVTNPLPYDQPTPPCSHLILRHSFAHTIDSPPFSTPYSPPLNCPSPWSLALLHFQASCKGEQYDRIAGLWLGGVELLRTSTAESTKHGVFWNVRKDVTRYSSLFMRSDLDLTMMLENVVNGEFTGVYHVTVNLMFFKDYGVGVPIKPSCERRVRVLRDESDGGLLEVTAIREDMGEGNVRNGLWDLKESPDYSRL